MNSNDTVQVWDMFVRIFHWTLVVVFAAAYLTAEEAEDIHVLAGYIVLGLVVARIVWGFVGGGNARFSSFVRSPALAVRYAKDVMIGRATRYLGHNPAGGLMIVLMLLVLLAVTISGIALYAVDEGAGPLAFLFAQSGEAVEDILEEAHELLSDLMLVLIAVHLLGVAVESYVHRESLIRAMFNGRKRR